MSKRVWWVGAVGVLAAALPGVAATVHLAEPDLADLKTAGFELVADAQVDVEAIGIADLSGGMRIGIPFVSSRRDEGDPWPVHAWILDSATREPVWVLRTENSERHGYYTRKARESLSLPAGRYEVYLFSGLGRYERPGDEEGEDGKSWFEKLFLSNDRDARRAQEALEECQVTVDVRGLDAQRVRRFEPTGEHPGALVRLAPVGNSELIASGFELARPATLRVLGFVERQRSGRGMADYGWIIDFDTREVVWMPRHLDTGSGVRGVRSKNRKVDEEVQLEAGRYVLRYGTDDSHAFPAFNSTPPFDPLNWGMTLVRGADLDPDSFSTFDPTLPDPWIDLTGVGNSESRVQAFRMKVDGAIHVRAEGERASASGFADRAWILDAATGRAVWEMTEANTIGGGGAVKNRSFDGIVELPRGEYVLHYTSDDSHAWGDWNAAAPFRPRGWGVSVRPVGATRLADVERIDEGDRDEEAGVLVRVSDVGDDERQTRSFRLDATSRISVYALGEGDGGDMYDYGYIVDADGGNVVWEMTYGRTENAGGHPKNRRVREEIELPAGDYRAIYVSDDSHSFGRWNVAAPYDPTSWGITIRLAD